jgi:hypothetical protein
MAAGEPTYLGLSYKLSVLNVIQTSTCSRSRSTKYNLHRYGSYNCTQSRFIKYNQHRRQAQVGNSMVHGLSSWDLPNEGVQDLAIIGTTLNPKSQEKVNKMLSIRIQWKGTKGRVLL